MARIVVVLPAPLGPRKPMTCPAGTSKERSSSAVTAPYVRRSPSSSSKVLTTAGYCPQTCTLGTSRPGRARCPFAPSGRTPLEQPRLVHPVPPRPGSTVLPHRLGAVQGLTDDVGVSG